MASSPGVRVNRWSGPNTTFNGLTIGSATEDNTRTLQNTAPIVAAFYPTMAGGDPPTLSAITPSNVSNYRPSPVTVELTGGELASVYELTIGGVVHTASITSLSATMADTG